MFMKLVLLIWLFAQSLALLEDGKITLASGEDSIVTATSYGSYGYFCTNTTPGIIVKVDLSNFTRVSSLLIGSGIISTSFIFGGNLYITTNSAANLIIHKIILVTFTLETSIHYYPISNASTVVVYQDLAYFATYTSPVNLAVVNLTSLSLQSSTNVSGEFATSAILVGKYLYIGAFSYEDHQKKIVVQFDIILQAEITNIEDGSISPFPLTTAATYGNYLFFGFTAKVSVFQISPFEYYGFVILDVTDDIVSVVTNGNFAFFGTLTRVVQFDMASLSYFQTINVPKKMSSVVLVGELAYFGTTEAPASIYRVNVAVDCAGAVGGLLLNNSSRTVYPVDASCSCSPGNVFCYGGNLTGNSDYTYSTCSKLTAGCSCMTPFGNLDSNASLVVYSTYGVCSPTCDQVKGILTCVDGDLVGITNFNYTTCSPSTRCHCRDAVGGVLGDSLSRVVYSQSGMCNNTCNTVQGIITCNNATLSGDVTFPFADCTPNTKCPCTDIVGGVVLHNQTKTVYSQAGICESTCDSIRGNISCLNGVLNGSVSYKYSTCNPNTACSSCPNAVGGLLKYLESRAVYLTNCDTNCAAMKGNITCNNGNIIGNAGYLYLSCDECVPLVTPVNVTLNSTDSVITMFFPAAPNLTVTYSIADPSSGTISPFFSYFFKLNSRR
jgi:hypothetical protein